MRVVVTADTHDCQPHLLAGDVLIHAGDLTTDGTVDQVSAAAAWLRAQPHSVKLVVAGNHDRALEHRRDLLAGLTYLQDCGVVVGGMRFWGSPWTPPWQNFAFMQEASERRAAWDKIPKGLDVLITHGPPMDVLDRTISGVHVGCPLLYTAVQAQMPRFHVFGHIHEGFGRARLGQTDCFNVSFVALNASGPLPGNPSQVLEL